MRSGILIISIVVALCVRVTEAEQPAQVPPGDILIVASGEPNIPLPPAGADPNETWDPVEHLTADWESIAVNMTSRIRNPAFSRSAQVEGPQWSLSMMGMVYLLTDNSGLVGWSWIPTSVLALDREGRAVASSTTNSQMVRWYTKPASRRPGVRAQNTISLNLPIDPNAAYPDLLGRVEWTMNVLLAEEVTTVEVPFQASEVWVELTPGMEILVERAIVDEGMYQYRIKIRHEATRVDYLIGGSIHLWGDDALPTAALVKMDVLNAAGESIRDLGGGDFSSSSSSVQSGGQWTYTESGNGTCSACGTAATIRYTLACNMYEREVRFVLQDIPMPSF